MLHMVNRIVSVSGNEGGLVHLDTVKQAYTRWIAMHSELRKTKSERRRRLEERDDHGEQLFAIHIWWRYSAALTICILNMRSMIIAMAAAFSTLLMFAHHIEFLSRLTDTGRITNKRLDENFQMIAFAKTSLCWITGL